MTFFFLHITYTSVVFKILGETGLTCIYQGEATIGYSIGLASSPTIRKAPKKRRWCVRNVEGIIRKELSSFLIEDFNFNCNDTVKWKKYASTAA
jgi:hypothetical protein